MSTKLLYDMSGENPDLQKQIGCMNGIFQIFHRRYTIGSRRMISQKHKKPPSEGQNGNDVMEPGSSTKNSTEKSVKNAMKEKPRVSSESSRTSFSTSTCSTGLSSIDSKKTTANQQEEPSSVSHTSSNQTPTRESPKYKPNSDSTRKSVDLRDVVKDSIYREARGIMVKTGAKEEPGYRCTLKYIDSPRPLQQQKSNKSRVFGLDESYSVLPKLHDSACGYNDRNDGHLSVNRRLSYDGRESRQGLKSTLKLKELPRLSLDSKQRNVVARNSPSHPKSSYHLKDVARENERSIMNREHEPESYRRPSSVVAKLMGLDILPEMELIQTEAEYDSSSLSSRTTTDGYKKNRLPISPRNSQKELTSPRPRNSGSVKKKITTSKFPMEPAPWRQKDESKGQSPTPGTPTKPLKSSLSVYGEIEKRLAQIEFRKSGKDLRALKQILEAMQKTKEKLESGNDHVSQTSNTSDSVPSSISQISSAIKGSNSPKGLKSAIVIMKPAKLTGKPDDSGSARSPAGLRRLQTGECAGRKKDITGKPTAKDLTPRLNHLSEPSNRDKNMLTSTLRSAQTLRGARTTSGENTKLGTTITGQRKVGIEKQSHPMTPTSNFSKTRKQTSRQKTEPVSPRRKCSPKYLKKHTDDQFSVISSHELVDRSHQCDSSSFRSDSNISVTSNIDNEVTSKFRSNMVDGDFTEHRAQKHKIPDSRFNGDSKLAEPPRLALEQPSPISVLDETLFRDESPSPVKKISNAFKDEEPLSTEAEWVHEDLNHLSGCMKPSPYSEQDHGKIVTIESLSMKLLHIEESVSDYRIMTPEHKYISEVLLASGLLEDLESSMTAIQLNPSGLPINSSLFLALEERKRSIEDRHNAEKIGQIKPVETTQSKLVFDAVNEILGLELLVEGSFKKWLSSSMSVGEKPTGQRLLRNLCSQIDRLQANSSTCDMDDENDGLKGVLWEDLVHETASWTNPLGEISGIVLDVERLIFKDLISEVVSRDIAGPRGGYGHRRQLFPK